MSKTMRDKDWKEVTQILLLDLDRDKAARQKGGEKNTE